jgi:hypothetical protein
MKLVKKLGVTLGVVAFSMAMVAQSAFAAADPTTGVDWRADVADPARTALTPALLAGLAIFVLFIAVRGGIKAWHIITKT